MSNEKMMSDFAKIALYDKQEAVFATLEEMTVVGVWWFIRNDPLRPRNCYTAHLDTNARIPGQEVDMLKITTRDCPSFLDAAEWVAGEYAIRKIQERL